MKNISIITIWDENNYGNRLQNYAVQEILKQNNNVVTIKNKAILNNKKHIMEYLLRTLKNMILHIKGVLKKDTRKELFKEFDRNINFSKGTFNYLFNNNVKNSDYIIVGSDQVWNPNFGRLRDLDLVNFKTNAKKISFSASFGVAKLPDECKGKVQNALNNFKMISVREDTGKEIVEELTGRKDVEVLVDPTMLLTSEEWDKVAKKPEQLKSEKYILNYFLGELSEKRKNEINRIAKENGCEVINILDKKSPFYQTGPSEFLYLEKHAFLICTDSFHSSVFAILYNRPFIVFEREDKTASMNSRIETLINKFNLKNRNFEGKITEENLKHDYTEAYNILEKEKEKSIVFLKKALEL